MSVQAPLQMAWPEPQTQWPLTQLAFCGQPMPQVPQLFGSVCVLVQTPLQADWPLGQVVTHNPLEQS